MLPQSRITRIIAAVVSASLCALFLAPFAAITHAAASSYYVSPNGSDTQNGTTSATPFKTIQKALDLAQPGDTINLAPGDYLQDIISRRNGQPGAPITITGPSSAVLKGGGDARIVQINHDYLTLSGFTIDGLYGNPNAKDGYRDKLLYVLGAEPQAGVTGLRVLNMAFKNAGGECVRLRYFAQNNEIANSSFVGCGVHDFRFAAGGKNGEAIYIGTAPEQRADGKNPTSDPDLSNNNWVHHNTFDTQGNECVDIKEAATGNIVEFNNCTGQKDVESAGFDSRGSGNIFRNNASYGNVGAGIRLGGDAATDGTSNEVYGNTIRDNKAGGIKFQRTPQAAICGNTMSGNEGGNAVGTYGGEYDPTKACGTGASVATTVPTATSIPPTATSIPPTATSIPPTSTPKPAATSTPTAAATSTPKPAATSTPVATATRTPAPTTQPTPAVANSSCATYQVSGTTPAFIEAERYSAMSGNFQLISDARRSGGKAMGIPGSGMREDRATALTFKLNVATGGTFYVWLLGYGKDGSTDSFYVQADTGALITANLTRGAWGWKQASSTVALANGAHTLRITNREDGSQVDKILLTRDKNYVPTGLGKSALAFQCS